MNLIDALIVLCLAVACSVLPVPEPQPKPQPNGSCERAIEHLKTIKCDLKVPGPDEQVGTVDDIAFGAWCEAFENYLDFTCLSAAGDCTEAYNCFL